ncbi:MAG: hypothetical protein WBF42_02980 [Terracidiphilus sp.]
MSIGAKFFLCLALLIAGAGAPLWANDGDDKDNYRYRVEGDWWFAHPQGDFGARSSNNYVNFNEDFHFGDYSTFTGKIDWRFKWKHHFLFDAIPFSVSRTVNVNRTIQFEGVTYDVGTQITTKLRNFAFSPGYQYDFLRRNWGYVGVRVNVSLLDTKTTLEGMGFVNGRSAERSASKSLLAPLPSFGPVFRVYPLPNSNRLSLEGSATGMYFFGYGSLVTAQGSLGIGITHGLAFRAGYQMGNRLSIHGASNQIGLRMTTTGPTAGLEYSWGQAPEEKLHEHIAHKPSNWHVDWIPIYLWFTGFSGYVGVGGYVVPVNESVSDVFSQLNIALMTALDVRRKRFGVLSDMIFITTSTDEKSTPLGAYSGFSTDEKTFFLDEEVYGRVVDTDRFSADATAGARIWHLNNAVNLYQGGSETITAGQTQDWVDPVIGARFRVNLDKGWYGTLKGDGGGFGTGSQETYQTFAGIGKEFKNKYSLLLGYRYFEVDYTNGGFLYNVHLNGPIFGLNIRCK